VTERLQKLNDYDLEALLSRFRNELDSIRDLPCLRNNEQALGETWAFSASYPKVFGHFAQRNWERAAVWIDAKQRWPLPKLFRLIFEQFRPNTNEDLGWYYLILEAHNALTEQKDQDTFLYCLTEKQWSLLKARDPDWLLDAVSRLDAEEMVKSPAGRFYLTERGQALILATDEKAKLSQVYGKIDLSELSKESLLFTLALDLEEERAKAVQEKLAQAVLKNRSLEAARAWVRDNQEEASCLHSVLMTLK
jgi:hypothetical protein